MSRLFGIEFLKNFWDSYSLSLWPPADVELLDGQSFVQPTDDFHGWSVVQKLRRVDRLLANRNQRIAELVQSFLRLGFCRLDHKAFGNDEGEIVGRRVESVVDQSLADVQCTHAVLLLILLGGENAFVHTRPIMSSG